MAMNHFVTGDRVRLTLGARTVGATVVIASTNGRSLGLELDGPVGFRLHGREVATLALLYTTTDDSWIEIVSGEVVQLSALPLA